MISLLFISKRYPLFIPVFPFNFICNLILYQLQHIKEEEDKEGYTAKIDKKSLLRLLMKLSKDGHIKVIKITLKGGSKEKVLSFVCEPDITTGAVYLNEGLSSTNSFTRRKRKLLKYENHKNGNKNYNLWL